jgi:hypothetical protein
MGTLPVTLGAAAAAAVVAAACGWMGARPPDLQRGPRMAPWRFMMLLAAAGAVLLLTHAANLLGVHTGR